MPNDIYINKSDATSEIIRVHGYCYQKSGYHSNNPDTATADIQERKSSCEECTSEVFYELITCDRDFHIGLWINGSPGSHWKKNGNCYYLGSDSTSTPSAIGVGFTPASGCTDSDCGHTTTNCPNIPVSGPCSASDWEDYPDTWVGDDKYLLDLSGVTSFYKPAENPGPIYTISRTGCRSWGLSQSFTINGNTLTYSYTLYCENLGNDNRWVIRLYTNASTYGAARAGYGAYDAGTKVRYECYGSAVWGGNSGWSNVIDNTESPRIGSYPWPLCGDVPTTYEESIKLLPYD